MMRALIPDPPRSRDFAPYASDAVTCPTCQARPGDICLSTGGGNASPVATHKARRDRVAGWTQAFANAAGWTANCYRRRRGEQWPDDAFAAYEAAAAPIPAKTAPRWTPVGVPLSEGQAEEIERFVMCGGYGTAFTGHLHGMARMRQTTNALERKGIIAPNGEGGGYERPMKLTPFGWEVYHHHRLIIKRLTDEQVAEQVARAESGRCLACGAPAGQGKNCQDCELHRYASEGESR